MRTKEEGKKNGKKRINTIDGTGDWKEFGME